EADEPVSCLTGCAERRPWADRGEVPLSRRPTAHTRLADLVHRLSDEGSAKALATPDRSAPAWAAVP
ncbi:hypothetical protein AB0C13_41090, partial [Streptomyces sp. NPDC049099]|uniref:hypothetical protein n=1 Tax=Streptomyces sp. NPDC049099 TaxID=3155768 RepID=UPI00341E1387